LGVGLSLARSIAELHGGKLSAASAGPEKGSEFVLRLPLAAPPERLANSPNEEPRAPVGRRILIVDDNIDAADSLGVMLSYTGHDIQVVYSGRDALVKAREFAPDTVILDLGMPEMDGYAVARAVRSDPSLHRVQLIALSGYGQAEDRRRTSEAGFDEHLVKPVVLDVLAAALKRNVAHAVP
jgi:two-component system, sensor histidine kinase